MIKFLFISLMLLSCSTSQRECIFNGCPPPQNPSPLDRLTEQQKNDLSSLKIEIMKWAPTCDGGAVCHVSSQTEKDAGDGLLWAGLLCLSGEKSQCDVAKKSQDSNTGQLYRNPLGHRELNDSSRDMLLGYLAYLSATKDKEGAGLLLKYIRSHDYKLCENATDNRCEIGYIQHLALWATMKKIWTFMNLEPSWEMKQGDNGDEGIIALESQFSAEGYSRHLVGVELFIRQNVNQFTPNLQDAANKLVNLQPQNPFFEYVSQGATVKAANLVLQKCPKQSPQTPYQWSWQRDESEQSWNNSLGWDCIFMINILNR